MTDIRYLSVLTDRFFPSYIKTEYTKFVDFFKVYFEYCEQEGKVVQLILDFLHILDIDKLDDSNEIDVLILEQYIKQYISQFPLYRIQDINVTKLIKNAKDFYSIKGTEKSYDFIFRLLNHLGSFSFYYPSKDILVTSHNVDGILSDSKFLHDNYYRAYYTYEIRSNIFGYVELKDIIENLLHPVGCKVFFLRKIQNIYDLDDSIEGNLSLIFQFSSLCYTYSPFLSFSAIYEDKTFEDIDEFDDLLSLMSVIDLGDSYNNLENNVSTISYYKYQKSVQLTLL